MAKIIFKMRYRKPGTKSSRGGHAKYIATREGVEFIHEAPLHAYADYISLRPRADRIGKHGLFSDANGPADLKSISRELDEHTGNVWLGVLSMRREDAVRLGYDSVDRWQTLLKSHTVDLAEAMNISLNHFRWCAAFHNERHHPHAHIIAWSVDPREGFISEKGIEKYKSAIARDVFAQDLLEIYQQETALRDELRAEGKKQLENLVEKVRKEGYENAEVGQLLLTLARRLRNTKGKKVYGYLRHDLRDMVNQVVKHIAEDPRIQELYDLWYIQKEATIRVYRNEMPERIPLHENPEFQSLRNVVIREAVKLGEQLSDQVSDAEFARVLELLAERNGHEESTLDESKRSEDISGTTSTEAFLAEAMLSLFMRIARDLEVEIGQDPIGKPPHVDRKLWLEIMEKKQDLGMRM